MENEIMSGAREATAFIDQFTYDQQTHGNLFFQLTGRRIISKSTIISEQEFKEKVNRSVHLLKTQAPQYYSLFCLFPKTICAVDSIPNAAAVHAANLIKIGTSFLKGSDSALAAVLIHETIHFWQRASHTPYDLQQRELEAIHHQIEVSKLLGVSQRLIDAMERERGTHSRAPQYYMRHLSRNV